MASSTLSPRTKRLGQQVGDEIRNTRPKTGRWPVTTGLNLTKKGNYYDFIASQDPIIVLNYLDNLDYGPNLTGAEKDTDPWDCDDKAAWGVAHVRLKYPQQPIGIAENDGHAVIIIWDLKKDGTFDYIYYDPSQPKGNRYLGKNFSSIIRVISFPVAPKGQGKIKPFDHLAEIYGYSTEWDKFWCIYPTRTADRKGVFDYLEDGLQNTDCVNSAYHRKDKPPIDVFYTHTDLALWNYVHVRRYYFGCAIGVAIGNPISPGTSRAVNIVWCKAGDTDKGKIVTKFWDPRINKGKGGEVSKFDVQASFM